MRVFAIVLAVFMTLGFGGVAVATVDHKVTICHATPADSAANGWVRITVAKQSIQKPKGHATEHDADIIPPFEGSKKWDAYGGKNWDSAGQTIWYAGCVKPEPTTPPVTTTTTTPPVTTTTTTPPVTTTTTTPPVTTTTTTEPPVTTTQPPTTTNPPVTTEPPVVTPPAPVVTPNAPVSTPDKITQRRTNAPEELAYTGIPMWSVVLGALILIGGGIGAIIGARRKDVDRVH